MSTAVHRLSTSVSTVRRGALKRSARPVGRPPRGCVLFSGVHHAIVPLTARRLIGRRRRCMSMARASVVLALCLLAAPPLSHAQAPPPATPAPATTAPAPGTPVMERVIGRALSLEEAVGIALETQPQIQARLSDYLAAAHRVDQALSPLLPQLVGSWTAARAQRVTSSATQLTATDRRGTGATIPGVNENTTASVTLSQLLFDFGKTFATTEAARRLAEVAQEDVELQRQLITLTVK